MTKFLALTSIFFYVLCWFTHQPAMALHNIGIALPWASLLLSIPIAYICKVKEDDFYSVWGYTYATTTILYVIVVLIWSGSIWQQLPHLATCTSLIAYFSQEKRKA